MTASPKDWGPVRFSPVRSRRFLICRRRRAADLPTMPETPPTIAATSLLTTVLSCAKPYNGRKKAASSAAVTGKVRQPVRRDAH